MTQFHKGQVVEVHCPFSRSNEATWPWCKTKVIGVMCQDDPKNDLYEVQFFDGSRIVFSAEYISEVSPA